MAKQITFFKKNKGDYSNAQASMTASEGNAYANFVLNRNNVSAWITTGSIDANNTTLTLNLTDLRTITDILLVKHNFKIFTIKYWNGFSFTDFSPAINQTNCTDSTNRFSFASINTTQIQIIIAGTQIPNSDKYLYQLIATEAIGRLQGWPLIQKPIHDKNKRSSVMLSGKQFVAENVGAFRCDLRVNCWNIDQDMTIVESLFNSSDGFLVWLCGGDQNQFSMIRNGYRLEDIFLMKCINSYTPEWYQGLYRSGLVTVISLAEVTN